MKRLINIFTDFEEKGHVIRVGEENAMKIIGKASGYCKSTTTHPYR